MIKISIYPNRLFINIKDLKSSVVCDLRLICENKNCTTEKDKNAVSVTGSMTDLYTALYVMTGKYNLWLV